MHLLRVAPIALLLACSGPPDTSTAEADMAGITSDTDMQIVNPCSKGFIFLSGSGPAVRIAGPGAERIIPPVGDLWYSNMVAQTFTTTYSQSGVNLTGSLALSIDQAARKFGVSGVANAQAPTGIAVTSQGRLNATIELCDPLALGKTYNLTVDCTGMDTGRGGTASFSTVSAGQTRIHCEWDRNADTWKSPDGKTFQAQAASVQPPMVPGPSTASLQFQWEGVAGGTSPMPGGILPNFSLSIQ